MVAVIRPGYSIRRAFHYNENKVKEGVAELISVQNYPMEQSAMKEGHRLNMLLKLAERSTTVSQNSIHISLNFAPKDFPLLDKIQLKDENTLYENGFADKIISLANELKDRGESQDIEKLNRIAREVAMLSTGESAKADVAIAKELTSLIDKINRTYNAKLNTVAEEYLQAIGFGNQPYLVYRHYDAGHPHIHIVTVKVDHNGNRIETQDNYRTSKAACEAIDIRHGLTSPEGNTSGLFLPEAVNVQKALYGKFQTKRAIGNILESTLSTYKFTSLHELNALLNLYNVHAETGEAGSRLAKYKGLQYRLLDGLGQPVGTPIKASAFYNRPVLKELEKKFLRNRPERNKHKTSLKNAIDLALKSRPVFSVDDLQKVLKRQAIQVVQRRNKDGILYGITFVDHNRKCVFNGRSLGENYGAKAIQARLKKGYSLIENPSKNSSASLKPNLSNPISPDLQAGQPSFPATQNQDEGILDILTRTEDTYDPVPYPLRPKKKKKKKKQE